MIKYPNKIKKTKEKYINFANRGLSFEEEINITNKYYLNNGIAIIYKKPTPIKIVKCSKYKNSYRIDEGYFVEPSTTDYNGLYKGKYVDFEAKSCNSTTSFSFANIHKHQIDHLLRCNEKGGITFLLINFPLLRIIFFVKTDILKEELEKGNKSFSIKLLKEKGTIVPTSYLKPVDYLCVIDELYPNLQ